jgi:hypothetical protein
VKTLILPRKQNKTTSFYYPSQSHTHNGVSWLPKKPAYNIHGSRFRRSHNDSKVAAREIGFPYFDSKGLLEEVERECVYVEEFESQMKRQSATTFQDGPFY